MNLIIDNPTPTAGELREARTVEEKAFKERTAELAKRGDNATAIVKTLKENKPKVSLELIVRSEDGKTKKVFTSEPFGNGGLVEVRDVKGMVDRMAVAALGDPILANPVNTLKAAQADRQAVGRTLQREGEAHYRRMQRYVAEIAQVERREHEAAVQRQVNDGRSPVKSEPYREKTFAERVGQLVANTPNAG
jgi:hypothetical protein